MRLSMNDMHECNLTKQPTTIETTATMIKTMSNDHPYMQANKTLSKR